MSRRAVLALTAAPALSSCATDFARYRGRPVAKLAKELGVCSTSYVVLESGRPGLTTTLGGCRDFVAPAPDAVFQAASLTKPLVAFGALRLVQEGRLDLSAPVSRYLPNGYRHFHDPLAQTPGDAGDVVPASVLAGIPVASLLNHTSGLPNWTRAALRPEFRPGERWQYSGEGFVMLQRVIEAASGASLVNYFDERVFGPLGMRDSSLVWKEAFAGRAEVGRMAWGLTRKLQFTSPVAAASLYTTAPDYARFLAALLADEAMTALTLASPVSVDRELGLEWGYGWGVARAADGPRLWQWGNNPGFRAFAMVSLASRDGLVILTNSEQGMALAASLADQVLPGADKLFRFPLLG